MRGLIPVRDVPSPLENQLNRLIRSLRVRPPVAALLSTLIAVTCIGARAETYPAKSIQIVLSYPAAGAADVLTRSISERLSKELGQAVVVDNKPGAGGAIGLVAAARARADGYTLYLASYTNQAIASSVYRQQAAHLLKDFEPIADVAIAPHALVVPAALPVNSVAEFIAYVKAKPGSFNYASQGQGTLSHLEAVVFLEAAGISMQHIPYKGSSDALPSLITNTTSMMFDSVAGSLPMVKAGKLKVLAVASAERSPLLPEVPTLEEAGVKGVRVDNLMGVFAPKGVAPAHLAVIGTALKKVLANPELQSTIVSKGMVLKYGPAEQLTQNLAKEHDFWDKVVKTANVTID